MMTLPRGVVPPTIPSNAMEPAPAIKLMFWAPLRVCWKWIDPPEAFVLKVAAAPAVTGTPYKIPPVSVMIDPRQLAAPVPVMLKDPTWTGRPLVARSVPEMTSAKGPPLVAVTLPPRVQFFTVPWIPATALVLRFPLKVALLLEVTANELAVTPLTMKSWELPMVSAPRRVEPPRSEEAVISPVPPFNVRADPPSI